MSARAFRVFEGQWAHYKGSWRGSVFSTFLTPVLYLLAMGMGLGSLVDQGGGAAELDIPYLSYLAPGLLAATAMQTGTGDGAWPVMAGIKWRKTYAAKLATPIRVYDLVVGHLLWVAVRVGLLALWFVVVLRMFGVSTIGRGFLAIGPAVLTGLAFSAPVMAFTASLQNERGLTNLFRFGLVPLFLFSGTFFPIEQLPDAIEPLAVVTPLWHGVELVRGAALGHGTAWHPLAHVAVLLLFIAVGTPLAIRQLHRRMIT